MLMSLRSIAHLLVVPVLRTPQAEKMEFSFTDICARIGKPASPKEVEYAKIRVRDQDDLAMLRRAQREQNTLPETMRITKQELENEKVEVIDDNEIVQTKTDPENIDPLYVSRAYEGKLCPYSKLVWLIDAKGQKKTKNPRVIPHFDRLFVKTQLYLPRYIFRVVHSESAGKVFVDDNNVTHFWSHAYMQYEVASSFESFGLKDMRNQVRGHVHNWKSIDGRPFASHFISTTDSFECAISWANRHFTEGQVQDVAIYVVDTHSLRNPATVVSMALALRAWNVLKPTPDWRTFFFMHGALTEWIFWDNIVASKVEKIVYGDFFKPREPGRNSRLAGLENVIPKVMEASRYEANTKNVVSRSTLHGIIYASAQQEKERLEFSSQARATRNGPLPSAPKSVQNDKRVQINDKSLGDVWNIVRTFDNGNLLFIWILSLMTETFYGESIVERVVVRHPEVIEESLEWVTKCTESGVCEKTLVCYMSGRGCPGRVDVNKYQDLMVDCIREWHRRAHLDPNHKYHGFKLYLVVGQARPLRNLVRVRQSGHRGGCKTETLLRHPGMIPLSPPFDQVVKQGQPIRSPETDEEHRLRIQRETGNVCYGPEDIRKPTAKRVRNNDSHRPTKIRKCH